MSPSRRTAPPRESTRGHRTTAYRLLSLLTVWLGACTGDIADSPLSAQAVTPTVAEAPALLGTASGFADERGGGIFADPEGKVVRLRIDGTSGRLESHPANSKVPGKVSRVFGAGPFAALVAADNGVYMAESGWLIEPAWRDVLDAAGIVGVAPGSEGVTWIAHQKGLFRIEGGQLAELKVAGASLSGLTALAVAPAPDTAPAVWFAQGAVLSVAKQTGRASYEVSDGGIAPSELEGGILALAGTTAAPDAPAELWLITAKKLFVHVREGWVSRATPAAPSALLASGRFVWLRAGDALFCYQADHSSWSRLVGLPPAPILLAAEPTGTVWLRSVDKTLIVGTGVVPRLSGLFEGVRIYQTELLVRAQFPGGTVPSSVSFVLDDDERVERTAEQALPGEGGAKTIDFAWGGFDIAGRERAYSLVGVTPGLHTLTVEATFPGGPSVRRLHFEYRGGASDRLSFAADVSPIVTARCAKCHGMGTGHPLVSFAQWIAEKDKIVNALVEQRMPADGPLDPTQLLTVQRWAFGGAAP